MDGGRMDGGWKDGSWIEGVYSDRGREGHCSTVGQLFGDWRLWREAV